MAVAEAIQERQGAGHAVNRPLRFDLTSAASKRDHFALFERMRAAGPVIPIKVPFVGPAWVATTHAANLAMLKDNALFVREGEHAGKAGVAGMRWWMPTSLRLLADNMLLKDEPDHRRLRKLVDGAFARRNILAMRGRVEAIADRILDGFEARGEVDLVGDFARRLPLDVISDLLGLPDDDHAAFAGWTRAALQMKPPFGMLRLVSSLGRMTVYLRTQIETSRRAPRPGLISDLLVAEQDGDRLSESELVSMVFLLLIAGFETTSHLIAASIVALEQHPDQKVFLFADPAGRMELAVEELARFTSPVQGSKPHFVSRDAYFFGARLGRGDMVMACIASANSDPAVFDRPEKLRLDRLPNPHLVFSSGIHFCLGMQLARVEAQSALGRLYARYPALDIGDPAALAWIEQIGIRGVSALPTRLGRHAGRLAA